jgi:hypothetical protein
LRELDGPPARFSPAVGAANVPRKAITTFGYLAGLSIA